MKRRHIYSAMFAAGLLTAAGSTLATADSEPSGLSISPSSVRPGQTVTLELSHTSCSFISAFSSPVLTFGQPRPSGDGTISATATVNADAKPGRYEVSARCFHYGANPGTLTYTAGLTIARQPGPPPTQQPPEGLVVSPRFVRPGQTAVLEVNPSCKGAPRFASPVLTVREPDPANHSSATATVNANAKPGRYKVSATCTAGHPPQDYTRTAHLTVAQKPTPPSKQQAPPHQVKQVPKGAAQTGGGGTAPRL